MASSDEENHELVYGLDDEDASSKRSGIVSKGLNKARKLDNEIFDNEEYDSDAWEDMTGKELQESIPKYEKNPKKRLDQSKNEEDENAPLNELLDLLQQENTGEQDESANNTGKFHLELDSDEEGESQANAKHEESLEDLLSLMEKENESEPPAAEEKKAEDKQANEQRKTITIKRDKPAQSSQFQSQETAKSDNVATPKTKSSITVTKITAPSSASATEDKVYTEKHTGIRISKSSYPSEIEMNSMLSCSYGKFYRLTELNRRSAELKDSANSQEWFSIFILGSKSETKSSAKGNSYVIWNIYDLNNLEREQDISLFLFGSGYKSHWKASEFQVFALIKPDFLNNNGPNGGSNGGGNSGGSTYGPNSNFGSGGGGKNSKTGSSWNSFANKKVNNQIQKLTLSIRAEHQLVCLGINFFSSEQVSKNYFNLTKCLFYLQIKVLQRI
jgi:hypothetical protein